MYGEKLECTVGLLRGKRTKIRVYGDKFECTVGLLRGKRSKLECTVRKL